MSATGMPTAIATRKKAAQSASDRRLEMVMVIRSLAAANAMAAGKRPSTRISASIAVSTTTALGRTDDEVVYGRGAPAPCRGRPQKHERPLTGPFDLDQDRERLLEGVLNLREGRVEFGTDALHDRDDGNRNAGCDQAVLDGGGARLVLREVGENFHGKGSLNHCWLL